MQRFVGNKTLLRDVSSGGTGAFPLTPGRESPHIKNNKLRDYRKHGTHYVYAAISISGPLSRPLAWVGVRVDAARTWFFFHQFRPDRRVLRYNVSGECPIRIESPSCTALPFRYDVIKTTRKNYSYFVKMTYWD